MLALGESDTRLGVVAGGYTRRPDLSCGSELNRSARIRRIGLVSALGAGSSPDGLVGRPQQCRTDPSTGQNVVFRWCSGKDALVAARGSSAPAPAPTTTTTYPVFHSHLQECNPFSISHASCCQVRSAHHSPSTPTIFPWHFTGGSPTIIQSVFCVTQTGNKRKSTRSRLFPAFSLPRITASGESDMTHLGIIRSTGR